MAGGREREDFRMVKFRLVCSKGKSICGKWLSGLQWRVSKYCFWSKVKECEHWNYFFPEIPARAKCKRKINRKENQKKNHTINRQNIKTFIPRMWVSQKCFNINLNASMIFFWLLFSTISVFPLKLLFSIGILYSQH